ncbi:8680_t:CDS:2, partial [Gigaspora rosea]
TSSVNNKNIHVISKEEAKRYVNPNAQKPRDCDRPEDLNQCMLLCHYLEQYNPEADLEFREQEMGTAVKRRAIAVHRAKVPKSHPDNRNDKPGNDNALEKKNSRTDWLRNKQIIVYNRAKIDDYLSNAFEQILYQVEERKGKSNA